MARRIGEKKKDYELYLEKKEKKLRKKMVKIMTEMESDNMYHGLSEEYARRDMQSCFKWYRDAIDAKREFAEKHPEKYGTP